MQAEHPTHRATAPWWGLALAFAAAAASWAVSHALPALSALLVAILLGVLLANLGRVPDAARPGLHVASTLLLRLGIVLLGLRLSLGDLLGLGPGAIALVVVVVVAGFAVAEVAGRALGVPRRLRTLIGAGTAICGAAAVAAVDDAMPRDRREEDAATALALVVLVGTLLIPAVPAAGVALGLSEGVVGLWVGASLHEVAQVVAAGGAAGEAALTVAVVVKLGRVLMLAPVIATLTLLERRARTGSGVDGRRPPLVPWFVVGFLLAAAVRTFGVLPTPVLGVAQAGQTLLLAAAMFALGCGVRVSTLRTVGGRPLILMAAVSAAVLGVGLAGAILLGAAPPPA